MINSWRRLREWVKEGRSAHKIIDRRSRENISTVFLVRGAPFQGHTYETCQIAIWEKNLKICEKQQKLLEVQTADVFFKGNRRLPQNRVKRKWGGHLPSLHDSHVKVPNLTFWGREHNTATFFFFSWTSIHSFRIELQKNVPTFDELNDME